MAEEAPAPILHHRSFEAVAARPLAAARLHDRQRLAILLQGAAVLAHLEQAGAFLPHGFDGAGVSSLGHLVLPPPRQGRAVELPQDSLRSLLALLFGEGEPVGRGEAKRIVRQLAGRWRLALSPLAPDRVVGEILGAADFLWQPDFAAARQSLVGELAVGAERRLLAAGPSAFRRTLLASGSSRAELEALLAGPSARELWRRAEAGALRGRGPAPTPAAAGRCGGGAASHRRRAV